MGRVAASLAGACLVLSTPASALLHDLTAAQIEHALAHGRAGFEQRLARGQAVDGYDPEWAVDLGPGKGSAYLWTEFAALSREARRYRAINRTLTPDEIQEILGRVRGRLVFEVLLYGGPAARFAKGATGRVEAGDLVRQARYRDIHDGIRTDLPETPFRAAAVFHFDAEGIDPQRTVVLVVTVPGAPEARELRFTFDLGALR